MHALYGCLTRMPYMYALYDAFYACLTCMPYMHPYMSAWHTVSTAMNLIAQEKNRCAAEAMQRYLQVSRVPNLT